MKIIDLLNKIANGEKIPLKIKVKGYEYRQSNGQFWCDETEMYLIDNCTSICYLNDEVEIIEEDKELKHIENYVDFANLTNEEKFDYLYEMETRIIDEVNRLKNKEK